LLRIFAVPGEKDKPPWIRIIKENPLLITADGINDGMNISLALYGY